jgi:hypothetical protein
MRFIACCIDFAILGTVGIGLSWLWFMVLMLDADLTLAGRDLATWTTYRGLDPEVSYQPPDILSRQEFLTMPLPREFIVRLDIRP